MAEKGDESVVTHVMVYFDFVRGGFWLVAATWWCMLVMLHAWFIIVMSCICVVVVDSAVGAWSRLCAKGCTIEFFRIF